MHAWTCSEPRFTANAHRRPYGRPHPLAVGRTRPSGRRRADGGTPGSRRLTRRPSLAPRQSVTRKGTRMPGAASSSGTLLETYQHRIEREMEEIRRRDRRRLPHKKLRLTPSRMAVEADLIVLAPFDGLGAAHHIIKEQFGTLKLAVSWKMDRACCKVQTNEIANLIKKADQDPRPWFSGLRPRRVRTSP